MPRPSRTTSPTASLSRRERQIMDAVFRLERATAAEILDQLPNPPCAAAVRTLLRILEDKGQLRHVKEGPRHVYFPTMSRDAARQSALHHLLGTFFDGSRAAVVSALLEDSDRPLSPDERAELDAVLDRLREEGR